MTDQNIAAAAAGDTPAIADDATKVTASVDLTKPDGAEPSEGQVTQEASDQDESGEPKRKSVPGSQKWKAKALALEAELEQARSRMGEAPVIPGIGEPPKEADYPDYFEYQAAKAGYEAAKRLMMAQAENGKQARNSELESIAAEQQQAYVAAQNKARAAIPDFDKVLAESSKSQIVPTADLAREIMSSEKAPLLQYHLSKPENWPLLREINQLSGRELAREIGRLEGRLHMPRARTQTNAPPPVSPVGSGATSSTRSPAEMSYAEFVKFRENGGKITL
jgi:hypothetical protein